MTPLYDCPDQNGHVSTEPHKPGIPVIDESYKMGKQLHKYSKMPKLKLRMRNPRRPKKDPRWY